MKNESTILRILDAARWSPSGDNTQPWRFELIDDSHFLIHVTDTRDWCVYDLDGRPTQLATGALLENIAIAASMERLAAKFDTLETPSADKHFSIQVTLSGDPNIDPDPLFDAIEARVTQRRAFSRQPLTPSQKSALETAVGENYDVLWMENGSKRKMTHLLFRWAEIPFSIPEGFAVHSRIIDFGAQFSDDKIPDQAVGLDPLALFAMKWAMKSFKRVDFLNRYFAGTLLPRIQLNLIPGYFCAAHFLLSSKHPLNFVEDYLNAGRAMQRFWLTATSLNLQLQPEMTPLIMSRYIKLSVNFTQDTSALRLAGTLSDEFERILGASKDYSARFFMGRIGFGPKPRARSTRLKVEQLLHRKA